MEQTTLSNPLKFSMTMRQSEPMPGKQTISHRAIALSKASKISQNSKELLANVNLKIRQVNSLLPTAIQ